MSSIHFYKGCRGTVDSKNRKETIRDWNGVKRRGQIPGLFTRWQRLLLLSCKGKGES